MDGRGRAADTGFLETLAAMKCKRFSETENGFEIEFFDKPGSDIAVKSDMDLEEMRRIVKQADEEMFYGSA